MAKDDLEDYVAKRGERERDFPDLVAAAEGRQALARKLAVQPADSGSIVATGFRTNAIVGA